jgi:tetratricopeptide (TPR) repeat protein
MWDIGALFEEAGRFHRAGQLAEAEQCYRQILAVDARHADSLHFLGIIANQIGRHQDAIDLIGQAITIRNDVPSYHNNLGNVLSDGGRRADAIPCYERALALKPDFAEAHYNLGNALKSQGLLAYAVMRYQHAVALRPDFAEAHNNLGNALKEQGRLADAAMQYERAVVLKPDYVEAHNNLAGALLRQGKFSKAVWHYQRVVALKPDHAEAHNNLGNILLGQGRRAEAAAHYERLIALNPEHAEAYNNLGNILLGQGRLAAAMTSYERAVAHKPDFAEAHTNLGITRLSHGRLDEAMACHERALALRPDFAEAHNNLGNVLMELGRLDEASEHFERALALKPDYADAHNNLGNALKRRDRLADAVAHYERAVALRPGYAEAYTNLGTALASQGRHAEAIANHERALSLRPDFAEAQHNLGNALLELGKLEEARRAYEKAIEQEPKGGRHYRALFNMRRAVVGDRHLAAMEMLARVISSLPVTEQIELHFALGKAYADLEERERSFHHLVEGNKLKRQELVYDEARALGSFDRIRTVFTAELMHRGRDQGDPSTVPIFIVGMPRSGTTLIEQILASHPRVFGAGERQDFSKLAISVKGADGGPLPFPEAVASWPAEMLRLLGTSYVDAVGAAAPWAGRITDKMPGNFPFAGLIHLALPNARIIHMRRDPIDTCLSCFSILFAQGQPYSYDLAELGRFYRAYEALMEHWRQVLPEGVMLDVRYEDVVADVEQQARRVVEHCGLEWNDACLAFYETRRSVQTASATQVRQPIYRSSVGRWRRYGDLLRPLLEELDRGGSGGTI